MADHSTPREEFRFGVPVYAADGIKVGDLDRLIVGGDGEVHALVVSETGHFSGHSGSPDVTRLFPDVVIPAREIESVAEGRIDVGLSSIEVRRLAPYLHHEFVAVSDADMGESTALRTVIAAERVANGFVGAPVVPPMAIAFTKGTSELEIERGENVMIGHGGDKLGTVQEIIASDREVAGVVVRPHGWFAHDVLLPIRVFGRSDDLALFVSVSREDLAQVTERFGHGQ